MQTTMRAMYSTFNGLINQIERMTDTASAMGQAFDDAKSDDYFYLPPEAFDSPDFQRGLKLMLPPDGKSAQFIITRDVDPATPEGISHVDAEMQAAKEAVKGTPLPDAKFYLGGTAATDKDIQVGAALLGRWFWWPLRVRSRPMRTAPIPAALPTGATV
jgi:putative drug exporter of the RND superfamily